MLVAAGLALASALCAGLMIGRLRENQFVTNMHAQGRLRPCKVPAQNPLFLLVDPSFSSKFRTSPCRIFMAQKSPLGPGQIARRCHDGAR
jgi:hypothetical protein